MRARMTFGLALLVALTLPGAAGASTISSDATHAEPGRRGRGGNDEGNADSGLWE
jgi:hypothetical protein